MPTVDQSPTEQRLPGASHLDHAGAWQAALIAIFACAALLFLVHASAQRNALGSPIAMQHLQYLEDRTKQLEESALDRAPFMPIKSPSLNLGYTHSAHWLKISTVAFEKAPGPQYLFAANTDAGEVTLFIPPATPLSPWLRQELGTRTPELLRATHKPLSVFDLRAVPKGTPWVYVRVASVNSLFLCPRLYTADEMEQVAQKMNWQIGFVVAMVLFAMASSLIWYIMSGDRQFFWLLLCQPTQLLLELSGKEYAFVHAWNYMPYWADRAFVCLVTLFLAFYAMQVGYALNLRRHSPYLHRLCTALATAMFCCFAWLLLPWGYLFGVTMVHAAYGFAVVLFLVCALTSAQKVIPGATSYTTMQLVFATIVCLRMLESFGPDDLNLLFVPVFQSDLYTFGGVTLCVLGLHSGFYQLVAQNRTLSRHRKDLLRLVETQVLVRTEELDKARQDSESHAKRQHQLLATMSHELRSPVSAVIGVSKLLSRDRTIHPAAREDIATIKRFARHLLLIVDECLSHAKGALTTAEQPELQTVAMQQFASDLKKTCTWMASHRSSTFRLHCAADMPPYLELNERVLRQVSINLITNAARYCEQGLIDIHLQYVERVDKNHSNLLLKIADNGRGMHPAQLKKLFEPFQKSADPAGLGLGMSIVWGLVESCGGRINVVSEINKGTAYSVEIPAWVVSPADMPNEFQTGGRQPLEPSATPNWSNFPDTSTVEQALSELPDLHRLRVLTSQGLFSESQAWLAQARLRPDLSQQAQQLLATLEVRVNRLDLVDVSSLLESLCAVQSKAGVHRPS